jgi:hypothetical protein
VAIEFLFGGDGSRDGGDGSRDGGDGPGTELHRSPVGDDRLRGQAADLRERTNRARRGGDDLRDGSDHLSAGGVEAHCVGGVIRAVVVVRECMAPDTNCGATTGLSGGADREPK